MAEPIRVGFRHLVRELRGGFVLWPGAITLTLAALAIGLSTLEERITPVPAWSAFLDRLFPPEPEAAHVVLGTIAGSMITVVSVVYSVLLVVLTFASTQFSPCVLVGFVEDRVSQTTLGLFIGTFTYCLLTLPAVRSQPRPFVPSIAVLVSIGLAIACLGCLLYFIHHMASSIQASRVVDRIARETDRVLEQVFPRPLGGPPTEDAHDSLQRGMPVLATRSGYIRAIDESGMLRAALEANAALRIDRTIGQFVMEGTPLFEASPANRATAALQAAGLRAFDIGPARTMVQDVEFGVLQIVDIALKAISPAVNDPTTALTCLDQLGRILVKAAVRQPPISTLRDQNGRIWVVLRRTSFPRLLHVAFSQIGHYGKADVAVPLRLMRILAELAETTPHAPYAIAIRDQARRLSADCTRKFPVADRDELNERLAAVEKAAKATPIADGPAGGSPH